MLAHIFGSKSLARVNYKSSESHLGKDLDLSDNLFCGNVRIPSPKGQASKGAARGFENFYIKIFHLFLANMYFPGLSAETDHPPSGTSSNFIDEGTSSKSSIFSPRRVHSTEIFPSGAI